MKADSIWFYYWCEATLKLWHYGCECVNRYHKGRKSFNFHTRPNWGGFENLFLGMLSMANFVGTMDLLNLHFGKGRPHFPFKSTMIYHCKSYALAIACYWICPNDRITTVNIKKDKIFCCNKNNAVPTQITIIIEPEPHKILTTYSLSDIKITAGGTKLSENIEQKIIK